MSIIASIPSSPSFIHRLKKRDIQAFEELYHSYSAALFSFIFSIVNEPRSSDKVLKQVFLQAFNTITEWDPGKASLFTWLLSSARNLAITEKKEMILMNEAKSADPLLFNEITGLKMLVEQLSEPCRSILLLAYFENRSNAEIAFSLDISHASVKSHKNQALIFLSRMISQQRQAVSATR